MTPSGWKDDGTTLTAPNGFKVVLGFRSWVLSQSWDAGNVPLENEHHSDQVLLHNASVGGGQVQIFQNCMLWYTDKAGVHQEPQNGSEILAAYTQIASLNAQIASLNAQPSLPASLKSELQAIINTL